LAKRSAERPFGKFVDEPDLLGERDELGRLDRSENRMLPTSERLHPGDGPGAEGKLRLIVKSEIPSLQRDRKRLCEGFSDCRTRHAALGRLS
jgi:hypothetical protein